VGTAFDYALRWGLSGAGWALAAESDAELVDRLVSGEKAMNKRQAKASLFGALSIMSTLRPGTITPAQAGACIALADFDAFYRGRGRGPTRLTVQCDSTEELRALYAVVPWSKFKPRMRLVLNPTFGIGSRAVGGADADLALDEAIVEVKTGRNAYYGQTVLQLASYGLLARGFGISHTGAPVAITNLSIYEARLGALTTLAFHSIVAAEHENAALDTLLRAASEAQATLPENISGIQ
jgi:hypothetical protein